MIAHMRARARTDELCLASETAEELWLDIWRLCGDKGTGLVDLRGVDSGFW